MKLFINCDGGARGNPGPAAAAFVVRSDSDNLQEISGKPLDFARGKYLGIGTNNEAEYQAVVEALTWLEQIVQTEQIEQASFSLDSSLVVNQLNGVFKMKEPRLREFLVKIRQLEQALSPTTITYSYIPREENAAADQLVNETLDREA